MTKYALFQTLEQATDYTARMIAARPWERNVTYSTVVSTLPGYEGVVCGDSARRTGAGSGSGGGYAGGAARGNQ